MDLLQNDSFDASSTSGSFAVNSVLGRQSRVSSVINPNYEQVSVREIVSRFKDKSHKRRKSLKLEDEISSATKDADERTEYYLEAPKTGLMDENEIVQPMFLPTACESVYVEPEIQMGETTKPFSAKKIEEIRNLVYCRDPTVFEEHQERLRNKGTTVKQHFGLTFESNFECGNLFQAESVVRKGAALGAPEEYDLFLRMDPSSHKVLYPPCAQWFFFRIENTKKRLYRFNIHFLSNGKIAYADGKRPMMISEADFNGMDKEGWKPCGTDITFEESYQRPLMYKHRDELPILDGPLRPRLFKLSFTFAMKQPKDTVYFAYEVPYTFTQLQNFIYVLSKNPFNRKHLQIRTLCRSLAGNRTDILVITEDSQLTRQELLERDENGEVVTSPYSIKDILPSAISALSGAPAAAGGVSSHHSHQHRPGTSSSNISSVTSASYTTNGTRNTQIHSSQQALHQHESSETKQDAPIIPRFLMKMQTEIEEQREKDRRMRIERARKPAVIIFGRLHPNETCTSWMCEGIIRFLLGENITAKLLRERFVFYIVPMVNIDGVVNGYARHDIAGYDLATQWANPSPVLHSALFGIKHILRKLEATTKIAGFFDLRGHSHRSGFSFHSQLSSSRKTHSSAAQTNESTRKNDNSSQNTDPENFDPRMFYYAAARRCKNISLKQCHIIRHIPHYPSAQSQQQHQHSGDHHHSHHDYRRNNSHHSLPVDPYRGEWWKSKDATARMVMTHQLHVGLSVTVEASTYRSALSSAHMKEVKYLSPSDYAVFGSQLCLSLIDIYLSKEADVQMRLSNSSFMITSSGGAAGIRNNAQQMHNMAEILQHLPAMLDQVDEVDEPDSPQKEESSPYETATVDPARRRRPRYRNSTVNRISFHIGSSDVDDHLKRLSNDDTIATEEGTMADKKRKSEMIELDDNDMQRVDYFNEDLWEHDSQASSDADGDHGDIQWLNHREGEEKSKTPTNHLSALQRQHQQHSHQHGNDKDNARALNYLFFQSQDVVQRTLPYATEEEEYPPARWLNIRRAEYLGLIAPRIKEANESEEISSKQGEHDDELDEGTKKSSTTGMQLTTTEHVFRMGPATSSFKPVKVMAHSDKLVAAIAEKQSIQQKIQQQLQQSADLTALSTLPAEEDQQSNASTTVKSRGNTTVFDDEDDGDNGDRDGGDGSDTDNGRRSRNNKRQDKSRGNRTAKKSLIQFSYSKSSMRKSSDKVSAEDNSADHHDEKAEDGTKEVDVEDDSQTLTPALSAKAAMQRVGQLRHQRKSTLSSSNPKSDESNAQIVLDNKSLSPHPLPKGGRSTIAVIPSTASSNPDTMMTGSKVVDLPGLSPIPPSSLDAKEKDKQQGFRRKTTIGSAAVPNPAAMATPTSTIGSNGTLSLTPVNATTTETRPKISTTIVLQRVPIIKEEPSVDDADSITIANINVQDPTSPIVSKFKPKLGIRKSSTGNVQQREKEKIPPNIAPSKVANVKQEDANSQCKEISDKLEADGVGTGKLDAQSIDNVSLASSVEDNTLPTELHVTFASSANLQIDSRKQSPTISTKKQLPLEPSTFTKELTQILEKAVNETPALAFAPVTTAPYISPIEMAAKVVAEKPIQAVPNLTNMTAVSAIAPQNLAPFAEASIQAMVQTGKSSEIHAKEKEVCLAATSLEVPSIAYSAYPGELPAGYTPQKRRGRRASTIMGPQYSGVNTGASSPANNALDAVVTVKQLQEQQNLTDDETIVTTTVSPTKSFPPKEVVIKEESIKTITETISVESVSPIANDGEITPNEPVSAPLQLATRAPTSPELPPKKKEVKKRHLNIKNPLLLNSYQPPSSEIASVNALSIPTDEDELTEKDTVVDVEESFLPPLPSLANLSDEQLQRAIQFASIKQKEQLKIQEEAAVTSAKVLPLVSTSAYLPIPFVNKTLTGDVASSDDNQKTEEAFKGKVDAFSRGDNDDDDEVENHLAMLGRDVNRTVPPSPSVHSSRQQTSSRQTSRQGQQQFQKLLPSAFVMDDEDDDFDMDDDDEDAYDYDPHHPRGGGTVHSRGTMPPSSSSPAAASRRHRKRRVQIIREYLQDRFGDDTLADNQMFFATVVPDQTSPRSEGGGPFDRTIINEEGHRVHFLASDESDQNHNLLEQLQYQSNDEKQASMVAASLKEWRDHHHKPLSKALAISFITPAMKKLSDTELEAKYQQEAEQKCLRELGLTYNYVFGGIGSLQNRPPPAAALSRTNALKDTANNITGSKPVSTNNTAINNTMISSQMSLLTNSFQDSSTNVTNILPQPTSTISSSIDTSRPLGPAGTYHKGFPQRGGAGRRYEMSYATDSAAYRLHAYYQHILHELKRRKLVPKDVLEATATQLFETVLTDPLHRQQVPVKVSSSCEHASLPFAHTTGALPSEVHVTVDETGRAQPISMSLSLQIVPPAKQLTPYRRFIKRPQLTNGAPKDEPVPSDQGGSTNVAKLKRAMKSSETNTSETEEMQKSRLLQERLQRIALIQENQSRMLENEKEKYLSDLFLDQEKADSVLPEWLSLSPRLYQQYLSGQSMKQRSSNKDESREESKTVLKHGASRFPWFKTTTTTAKNGNAVGKETLSSEIKDSSIPQETKEEEEMQPMKEEKHASSQMVFDDENDDDVHASAEETKETTSSSPPKPTNQEETAAEIPKKKLKTQKRTTNRMKTAAKIQTMQLFSGFDVLVPPVQLSSPRDVTTTTSTNLADTTNDTFQEKIRKRLLSKYRAHQKKQEQFTLDRSQAAIEAAKRRDSDAAVAPTNLLLVAGEYPPPESNEDDSEGQYNNTDDEDDEEKHTLTVNSLLSQQEYLSTGETSLLPAKKPKPLVSKTGRVSPPVTAKLVQFSFQGTTSQANGTQTFPLTSKSPETMQKKSPRNASTNNASAWLYQNGGKSLWDITHEPPASFLPGESAINGHHNGPSTAVTAAMDAVKAGAVSPVKMSVATLNFTDPSNPTGTNNNNNSAARGLSRHMKQLLSQANSNTNHINTNNVTGSISETGNAGDDRPSTTASQRPMESGGSDKPMTPYVHMPPAQAHAPPHSKIPVNAIDARPVSTRSNVTTPNPAETTTTLSPRISDIQRLTAAVSTAATPTSVENETDAPVKATASSAVALEVAARRPGGKKILLVQKQVVPTAPLLSPSFFSSGSKSKRHTTTTTSSNNSSYNSKSMHVQLPEDDDEDVLSRSSAGGGYPKLSQSRSGEQTQTQKTQRVLDDAMRNKHHTSAATTVIRAASSLDPTEKERNRAGAIGRLLVPSSASAGDTVSQPIRPSVPRPSQTTTTTTTTTVEDPNSSSNNGDLAPKKMKRAMKRSKQQTQQAQHVIEELRQINVAKL